MSSFSVREAFRSPIEVGGGEVLGGKATRTCPLSTGVRWVGWWASLVA